LKPLCTKCNLRPAEAKGRSVEGLSLYRKVCWKCHGRNTLNSKTRIRRKKIATVYIKKDRCDYCGFVALHPCQLDVDHIDGNSLNNEEGNHQTLCANCHRLKTLTQEDWKENP